MPEPFFVEGDTAATLQANCTDKASGAAINLTGKTVTLWFNYFGVPAVSKTMTVTDAAGGVAKYTFLAGELVKGVIFIEVIITNADSTILTSTDVLSYLVRAKLT